MNNTKFGQIDATIKNLEEIKAQLKKGEKREGKVEATKRKESGVVRCLVCKTFIDDPNQFTCGHPQCNKELRERLMSISDFLGKCAAETIKEAEAFVNNLEAFRDDVFDCLMVDSAKAAEEELEAIDNLTTTLKTESLKDTFEKTKKLVAFIERTKKGLNTLEKSKSR